LVAEWWTPSRLFKPSAVGGIALRCRPALNAAAS
jgi:hypothetical protein